MSLVCIKCKKKYGTISAYNRHMSKPIPCDIKYACNICGKIFKCARDIGLHRNRKFPCKPIIHDVEDVITVSEVNKTLELKIVLACEKTKQMEIDYKSKIAMIESRGELQLACIKAKSEADSKKTVDHLDKLLELEVAKTSRKKLTPKIINNIENMNININIIKRISDTYLHANRVTASPRDISENLIAGIIENFTAKRARKLFENFKTVKEITSLVLMSYLNNDNSPEFRNIFYIKESDKFFAIITNINGIKEVKPVDFDTKIFPIITQILDPVYDILLISNVKPGTYSFEIDAVENIMKYELIETNKKYLNKNQITLKEHSKYIFDEDNTLTHN